MERMTMRARRGLPRAAAVAICLALSACSIGDLPLRNTLVELGYTWEQLSKVQAAVPSASDQFGRSVALDGDWAAVGDNVENTNQGSVSLYQKTDGRWTFKQKLTGAATGHFFGTSVALCGEYLLVGAPLAVSSQGRAYVYRYQAGTWALIATLENPDGVSGSRFGNSAAISDSYALVGAPYQAGTEGRVFAFYKSEGGTDNWGAPDGGQPLLRGNPRTMGDYFGSAVAVSGEYAIIGIPENGLVTPSGGASIFFLDEGTWTQIAALKSANPAFDYFGTSVSISGDVAAVGAPDEEAVYVYARSGSSWNPEVLTASDAGTGPKFGSSVAVDSSLLAVGSPEVDSAAGSVYFFRLDSEGWKQDRKVAARDGTAGMQFGYRAALDGNNAVLSAPGNSTPDLSGAAYFFVRTR